MSDSHVSDPEILELPPDEVIRVLAVRPRGRAPIHESPHPAPAAPVTAPRLVTANPATAKPVRLSLVPDNVPARAPSPVSTPAAKTGKRERSLEETIDDLQLYAFGLDGESDDTSATTGVRHLRIEIDKPMKGAKRR